ncbi:uncharacterized protein METZ01_LOCUS390959 [marine metagenome]|uniref:Uncharacterized protein n=1 Tax=marine metagenome TaxID=408172 RepID=A0A382UWK3_9ZZZZ
MPYEALFVSSSPIGRRSAATLRDLAVMAPGPFPGEIRPDVPWDSLTDSQRAALDAADNSEGHWTTEMMWLR